MLQKFLEGKKKYSVFILTLLTAIVSAVVTDPGQQAELQEMLPMAAVVISGLAYLVIEGRLDGNREKTKQLALSNGQTTAALATAQTTTQQPTQHLQVDEPVPQRPPTAFTTPPFDESDDCLTQEQKQAIATWYAMQVTSPPTIPKIPKETVTLYSEKVRQNEQRTAQAGIAIMQQALKVFDPREWDKVLKMRKNCDVAIWHRVNAHWQEAMHRWIAYAVDLWKFQEGMPIL